jgi:hypothetical protein
MDKDFERRLDRILERVISDDFLRGRGLGNEIPFYAFDYPPEREPAVREHLRFLLTQIPKQRPDLRLAHVNLLELIVQTLRERNLYERSLVRQAMQGDAALARALAAPLDAGKLAEALVQQAPPEQHDLVFLSGVGSAYPLLRTHNLLNNLHHRTGSTPLVLFYPGRYDGQSLRLFGILPDKPYYRAFRLVD